MTGTTTHGHDERPAADESEGTTGYRHWHVRNGKLISPFAGVILPPNGTASNVSYYATRADLDQALWFLDTTATAWTTGTVTGTTEPDTREQTYTVHGRKFRLPECHIGQHYQVTNIYTDRTSPLQYQIPVHKWTV